MKSFFKKIYFPLKPFPALILAIIITGLICGAILLCDSHRTTQTNAPALAIKSDESNVAPSKQAQDATEDMDISIEEVATDSIGTEQKQNDATEKQEKSTNTNSSTNPKNSSHSSFTNKFGTPTTKCAHSGCNNFIASSGDTNCCTIHSRKCAECGKYIDGDATYCMDCISKAVTETKKQSYSSSGSSNSFSNEYGTATTKCAHPGCNNPIASSGDTNCCTLHSKRCLECGKYIDEDATYCISCLSKALQPSNSKSSGTSSGSYDFSGYSDSMSDAEFDAWLDDVLGF